MMFPRTVLLFSHFVTDLGIGKNFSANIFIIDLVFGMHQLHQPHLINIVVARLF